MDVVAILSLRRTRKGRRYQASYDEHTHGGSPDQPP
jgi:hypothetical protein